MTTDAKQTEKNKALAGRDGWGIWLFRGTMLAVLFFFWWLLIYSHGTGPHNG